MNLLELETRKRKKYYKKKGPKKKNIVAPPRNQSFNYKTKKDKNVNTT